MNNQILVVFTIKTEALPENFQEIIKHEQEVLALWKQENRVEHLFLRQTRNGAIIVFTDIDEQKAEEYMCSLPLYPFMETIAYFPVMKQF